MLIILVRFILPGCLTSALLKVCSRISQFSVVITVLRFASRLVERIGQRATEGKEHLEPDIDVALFCQAKDFSPNRRFRSRMRLRNGGLGF